MYIYVCINVYVCVYICTYVCVYIYMYIYIYIYTFLNILPGGSGSKESTCNAGDPSLIPGLGRSPGGGHGNPLQYYCLENPMD